MYKTLPLTDKRQIREFYYQDRPLTAYSLGDLEDGNWQISTFTGAFEDEQLDAVSLIWHGTDIPVLIVVGEPDGVRALIHDPNLPDTVFYMMPAQLLPVLREVYTADDPRNLWRMVVRPGEFIGGPKRQGLRRLTQADADRVKDLFADDTLRANRFDPDVMESGVFYGIEDSDGDIVALAGTHIYAESEGVAVVGYVYTAQEVRGRGLGTAVTGAVTRELINRGIDHVVLNVEQNNTAAVRSYQKLGFRIHAPVVDGVAHRRR
jgi:ribosomal protein S18 acetylase RimI-like enzyme